MARLVEHAGLSVLFPVCRLEGIEPGPCVYVQRLQVWEGLGETIDRGNNVNGKVKLNQLLVTW